MTPQHHTRAISATEPATLIRRKPAGPRHLNPWSATQPLAQPSYPGRSAEHGSTFQIPAPPKARQLREKRAETLAETIRQEYGGNFAKGYRGDAHLGTVREDTGKRLHQLVKESKK